MGVKEEFDKLKEDICMERFSLFHQIRDANDLLVSNCNTYLYVIVKNKFIHVIDIIKAQKVTEIIINYNIKGICQQDKRLITCGEGISIYESFNLLKKIEDNKEIRSICSYQNSLFSLSSNTLQRMELDTFSLLKSTAFKGKMISCNSKSIAGLSVGMSATIWDYDLIPIETILLACRFIKIQLTSTDLLIAGGNNKKGEDDKKLQIFDIKKKTLYAEYRPNNMINVSNFCVTHDSEYLVTFSKELNFYNLPEKKNHFKIKNPLFKENIRDLKTVSMSFSSTCNQLYYLLKSEIYCLSIGEKYLIPKTIRFPNTITALDFKKSLFVNHEIFSVVDAENLAIQNFSNSDEYYATLPKSISLKKEIELNRILNPKHKNLKKIQIYDADSAKALIDKINLINSFKEGNFKSEIDSTFKVVGTVNEYTILVDGEKLEVWKNDANIHELNYEGFIICYKKASKFVVFSNWEVKIYGIEEDNPESSIFCDEILSDPIFYAISENDMWLYVANDSFLTIWSLYDSKYLGKINYGEIECIAISDSNIFISSENILRVYTNPLNSGDSLSLLIPEKYSLKYWKTLKNIIENSKLTKYEHFLNKCVILPICCNILHIFTHYSNKNCISQALKSDCYFIRTVKNRSPITIAIEQKTINIIDCYIKEICNLIQSDKNVLHRIEDDIVKLNKIGTPSLFSLYNSAFIVPAEPLPRFGIPIQKGKRILISQSMLIDKYQFLQEEIKTISDMDIEDMKTLKVNQTRDKVVNVPLEFRISAFRIPLVFGSNDSIEFLKSLLDCENQTILETPLINSILMYKWNKVYYWILLQLVLFMSLFILICIYFISSDLLIKPGILISIEVINAIFFIHTVIKASVNIKNFISYFRNLVYILRFFLIFSMIFEDSFSEILSKLLRIYVIISISIETISYFSIYKPTRFLVFLFKECIKDMLPFLVILLYLTMTLALTIYNIRKIDGPSEGFGKAWIESYSLNFNIFTLDGDISAFNWLIIVAATLVNPLVLMNMIIALLGKTYSIVKENALVAELREITEMIVETESLLVWKKKENQKYHIQICVSAEKIEEIEDPELVNYVKIISNNIPKIRDQLTNLSEIEKTSIEEIEIMLKTIDDTFTAEIKEFSISIEKNHKDLRSHLGITN